ncbi:hypothetical protein [Rahnella variigena]|uniref:Uncharacterized protein n=1 Tax=Rahnella variigena TaxID=574964 RepID=A0ABX9PP51_9GAMM|nr:hypothetical protein [Rahnella variigena]RJT53616.1 hypothetical protein D6D38_11370 [Rahnella variigena]RKF66310.1 hypothetical protein CKQ54_23225 [Rahnella variigena]
MAKPEEPYRPLKVESYEIQSSSGKRGKIHIRPLPGQWAKVSLQVECSKKLSNDYPVGSKFEILAKLTDREEGGEYIYSSFRWKFKLLL